MRLIFSSFWLLVRSTKTQGGAQTDLLCGNTVLKKKSTSTKKPKSTFSYQFQEIKMRSEVLYNVLHEELLSRAKIFIRTLLLSEFNTHQGLNASADIPRCCNNPVINLKRPAVLRVYYGLSEYNYSSPYVVRPTYGPTRLFSSVGLDPNQYTTKPFTPELSAISRYLKNLVSTYKVTGFDNAFDHDFNHCSVLVYRSNEDTQVNSTLSFHCDSTYDTKGRYQPSSNSQLEESSVFVLTLGDSRELRFQLRAAVKNKWITTNADIPSVHLIHNSLFILHHEDELPIEREDSRCLSQIMHGGIKLNGTNKLSIALCFRAVTKKRLFDPITNKLVTTEDDMSSPSRHASVSQAVETFERNELPSYQTKFHQFVRAKFEEWKWFSNSI